MEYFKMVALRAYALNINPALGGISKYHDIKTEQRRYFSKRSAT